MHALLITFRTADMPQDAFRDLAAEVAPAFSEIPGLITKIWLDATNPAIPGGGGVYLFERREDAEAYLRGELYRSGVARNRHLTDVEVVSVPVLEGPTRITSPGLSAVAA